MKTFLIFLCPLLSFAGISEDLTEGPMDADQITDQWLVQGAVQPHSTGHIVVFKRLFEATKVKTLLEFGLGYSTKYFLDHANKVLSIDFITHGYGPNVMQKFLKVYADYSNWIPIAFFSGYMGWDYSWAPYKHLGSDSVYRATSYQNANCKNYAKIDDFYLVELNAFITNLLKYNRADVAFIGHAIILRGDIAQLLFQKVPIVIVHNSNARQLNDPNDLYGISSIAAPDNYEEIFFAVEGGTTAWVQKTEKYAGLIDALQKFAATL